jgi:hypothetical protein
LNYYFWSLLSEKKYFKKPISEIAEDIINEKKIDFDLNYYFWSLLSEKKYFKKPISEIAEDIINEKKIDYDFLENKEDDD